jgi:hypothetical protein
MGYSVCCGNKPTAGGRETDALASNGTALALANKLRESAPKFNRYLFVGLAATDVDAALNSSSYVRV